MKENWKNYITEFVIMWIIKYFHPINRYRKERDIKKILGKTYVEVK